MHKFESIKKLCYTARGPIKIKVSTDEPGSEVKVTVRRLKSKNLNSTVEFFSIDTPPTNNMNGIADYQEVYESLL